MPLWSDRVEKELAPEVAEFLRAPDRELLPYDCAATKQHAERLHGAGLLSDEELAQISEALDRIAREGGVTDADEDVHSAIERLLGELGRKIHAGRSRNDQVVAAMRLYVQDACAEASEGIRRLASVLLDRAEAEAETLIPGYTHMQRAQPVTLGHHLLAWVEMLERDLAALRRGEGRRTSRARSERARWPARRCRFRRPRSRCATRSTPSPTATSRSTTCTRSRACFSHLSRMAMELCLWASAEYGFLRLPEEAATGSSMMPQKLNPDVAELVRGKAGTAAGRLAGLLAVLKGLPLAYNTICRRTRRRSSRPGATCEGRSPRSPCSSRPLRVRARADGRGRLRSPSCSPPTPPRSSSPRELPSATPTARSPARSTVEASSPHRPPPTASPSARRPGPAR